MARKKEIREKILLVITLVVLTPILFVIIRNVSHAYTLGRQISAIDKEAEHYQKQIEKDSLLLESIKYDEGLERFARENFFMQRRGERVFVIE